MVGRLSNQWKSWINLSGQQKKLFLYSLVYLKVASFLLLLFRYQDLHAFLKKRVVISTAVSSGASALRAAELAGIVEVAARRRLVNATCLRRSLVLWYLLRREAIASELCFGVRKEGGDIVGHAWVEIDGEVINDNQDNIKQYTPIDLGSR